MIGLAARSWLLLVAGPGVVALACLVAGQLTGADPLLLIEFSGGALVATWAGLSLRNAWLGHRLAQGLARISRSRLTHGISCEVMSGGGRHAFVLGAVRPRIYVGDEFLAALHADELRAVLLHEDHHRRTFAPLRTAALEAWLTLLGRSGRIRALVLDRLGELEELADAHALQRGVRPATLASALLKGDTSRGDMGRLTAVAAFSGAAFSGAADRRVAALLDAAAGRPGTSLRRYPYEWLPPAILTLVALGCHAPGIPLLG